MKSTPMSTPVATATSTRTSIKTYLAIAAIGGASFAAAMFVVAGPNAVLGVALASAYVSPVISEGASDVTTLSLQLGAQRGAVTVTDLTLDVVGDTDGDLLSVQNDLVVADYVQNCSLYHNQTLLSGPEPVVNNQITFSGMSVSLRRGVIMPANVHCDFVSAAANHAAPYALAWSISQDTSIVAEDGSGNALAPQQIFAGPQDTGVNLQSSQFVTLHEHGDINIVLSGGTPRGDILVQNTDREVGVWTANAELEDMQLEKLTFSLLAPTFSRSIATATLAITTNGTTSQTVPLVNGVATFQNLTDVIPVNGQGTLSLSVQTAGSSLMPGGSGVSGDNIQFALDTVSANSFEAVGTMSGSTLNELDVPNIAQSSTQAFVYRYTEPVVTLSSLSPSGMGVPADMEVLRFNIAANAADDVMVRSLTFRTSLMDSANTNWNQCGSASPVMQSHFDLFNLTAGGLAAPIDVDSNWNLMDTEGITCNQVPKDLGYVKFILPTPITIPAGSTHTFALYFDASGASAAGDDSLRFDISGPVAVGNSMVWDDGSGYTIQGNMVNNLPVSGGTIVF